MNIAVKYIYSVTCEYLTICLLGGINCFLGYSLDNKRQRVYLKYIKQIWGGGGTKKSREFEIWYRSFLGLQTKKKRLESSW